MFADGNPAGIKHAMKVAGLDSGELRLPLWEANDATKAAIERAMDPTGDAPRTIVKARSPHV